MPAAVHRIEVRPRPGTPDPVGETAARDASQFGLPRPPERIDAASVYLIEGPLDDAQVRRVAEELLADPVTEEATIGSAAPSADALVEVHPLPGVMDPDAEPIELAIEAMLEVDVQVRTGRRYDLHGTDAETARTVARRVLANPVIHAIHETPYRPDGFPAGSPCDAEPRSVPLLDLDDEALQRLSRDAHLFLSLEEMQAIRDAYRAEGREPREIELETLAQTWSEHCVHKTLKARVEYRGELPPAPGGRARPFEAAADGTLRIDNLLKSTIAAATERLMADGVDYCLSVFVDNAGVIAFDDENAVCFKVETHNHPSAIEPYGGAATGIGGCIRDILGTGLAARPIAATDVFCVAFQEGWNDRLPAGCLHPKRILSQVVAGVRDYGNRMGIPTLNGAVWFHDDYVGNPLVYCGCVGVLPRDKVTGDPQAGDRIIALGGRTGRDGIHGATFSSSELTDAHADEFAHAVQIGNPVTEKKLLDAIMVARDHASGCLFNAITDCGAGGFSSAVGEMGEKLGASVHLECAPLKYDGLTPTEIWISEAQERMVLAVPPANVAALQAVCDEHDVELCDLGEFGTEARQLILTHDGREFGRLSMSFLHDGIPSTTRVAEWTKKRCQSPFASKRGLAPFAGKRGEASIGEGLSSLLSHPNIASKHWIIRQYDHEVQGRAVVNPLVGPTQQGPSDAAVTLPVAGSTRGLAIGNGLATGLAADPYLMTLAAIDECVRNLVCVGADPRTLSLLDNFCWPSCGDTETMARLVRACVACYDGAMAYRAPFISGKDSLNNQFATEDGKTIRIPPTLLISGFGIVPDVRRCLTMDAKSAGNALLLVGATDDRLGGSHYEMLSGEVANPALPEVDLDHGPAAALAVHEIIAAGLARAAHDCSDGGLLVAAAEMAFAGGLGLALEPLDAAGCFAETPGRYLLEVEPAQLDAVRAKLGAVTHSVIGAFDDSGRLTMSAGDLDLSIDDLRAAWLSPLDY